MLLWPALHGTSHDRVQRVFQLAPHEMCSPAQEQRSGDVRLRLVQGQSFRAIDSLHLEDSDIWREKATIVHEEAQVAVVERQFKERREDSIKLWIRPQPISRN